MPEKPLYPISTVDQVRRLPSRGPWPTKSNGQLNVLFGIDFIELNNKYFHYEESELNKIAFDIRGLRAYNVSDLKSGSIGANEWHRVRRELVFVIKGSVKWTCEDVYGKKVDFILNRTTGISVPPFILHTYQAQQDETELLCIANTLYLPDDKSTHDTFDLIDFKKLQKKYLNS